MIIGRGRVARHFARYFDLLSISYTQWHRGMEHALIADMAAKASHIFLLINDDAVASFAAEHLADVSAFKIHFSGSLTTPDVYGAHPLMTFGQDLYDLETYRRIAFVIEETAPANDVLLPLLSNQMERIAIDKKPLYHALCVMAGNFSCLLWQKFFESLKGDLGLPPEIGQPYLQQQTENILRDYRTALTGPLARGDSETLNRNMAALTGDAYQDVYKSFVKAYEEKKTS